MTISRLSARRVRLRARNQPEPLSVSLLPLRLSIDGLSVDDKPQQLRPPRRRRIDAPQLDPGYQPEEMNP